MPRKKKVVEEDDPIVIYEPSEYFYRCYLFGEEMPNMTVDSSGTLFARNLSTALLNLCEDKTSHELLSIAVASLFGPDDIPIEFREQVKANEWMSHLTVLRVKIHDKTELENISQNDDGDNVILSLKDLQHGCDMAMQEYLIDNIEFSSKPGDAHFNLKSIKAHVPDVDRISREFEESIQFKFK